MNNKNDTPAYKPDWVPEDAGEEFATKVVKGVEGGHDGLPAGQVKSAHASARKKSASLRDEDYIAGVRSGDRTILGRTITLIESHSRKHREQAQRVLQALLPHSGHSLRVGISGVPGAGKSTLIETLGCYLIKHGHKVAVLAVDPSSSVTKGSILGDKTRMEKLSRETNAFIRPSPSGGTLGGVARKSRETILVCEAAGYDIILIETVGVGQSEITVRSMVDFFLLVMIPGAGDELQGIKKGVMEIADALAVNKADGDNIPRANLAKAEYENALHYIQPATPGWQTPVFTCSALTGDGIDTIWNTLMNFKQTVSRTNTFAERRRQQSLDWMLTMVEDRLKENFYNHPHIASLLATLRPLVAAGQILPTDAADQLLETFNKGHL